LTTKIKNKLTRENHETKQQTNHTQKAQPANHQIQVLISWKLLLIQDARVHYVVLKQQPHTTHPTHTTCMIGAAGKPETKSRTRTPQRGSSRSCCLRTQQCAKRPPGTTHHTTFLNPKSPY
jgi:hypothetical protein